MSRLIPGNRKVRQEPLLSKGLHFIPEREDIEGTDMCILVNGRQKLIILSIRFRLILGELI
jgi:hypothetical protein